MLNVSSTFQMSNNKTYTLKGLAVCRGFAVGNVYVLHNKDFLEVEPTKIALGSEQPELNRLRRAHEETKQYFKSLISSFEAGDENHVGLFECHLMMLDDPLFIDEAQRLITETHLCAESALHEATLSLRKRFEKMSNPYFRERVGDLDDVEKYFLKYLKGDTIVQDFIEEPSIIVATDLTPSETVRLPKDKVLGFATDFGSLTSHVALLLRAMGVPSVMSLGDITKRVKTGDKVLLNGTDGNIVISPSAKEEAEFAAMADRNRRLLGTKVEFPAGRLKDSTEVKLLANVHPGMSLDGVKDAGARGIGLYRSEYLWLGRTSEPAEQDQVDAYRQAALFAHNLDPNARTVVRVLDIGGDKLIKSMSIQEDNPFLGNRSIRYLLSNIEVFRRQIRAILRASEGVRMSIMYPMVSCIEEVDAANSLVKEEKLSLIATGAHYVKDVTVGAMIEVPSAALIADALAERVDFFSIGTNDLVQYTLAADRANESVAHLYQPAHPAVLKLVRMTIEAAHRRGIKTTVCGESAADPVLGTLWAAFGVDSLSMTASYIPSMARVLAAFDKEELEKYAQFALDVSCSATAAETYDKCRAYLRDAVGEAEKVLI